MAHSKVKSTKQRLRLQARIEDWDKIGTAVSAKQRRKGDSQFTKPGSNKK